MNIPGRNKTDPRKVQVATSLQAAGSVPTPAGAMTEQGSERTSKLPDKIPALVSRSQAIRVYDEMTNNDATVDVSLRAAKIPVMGGQYFIEPFDNKQINLDIAEFVSYNILEGTNQPFLLVLENILRMFDYGASVLEPVWELGTWTPRRTGANARQYTMLRKLGYRPASTITEFQYDDAGGPVGIKQNALKADNSTVEVTIPIEKLMIFTLNKNGGNLEGKSLLRTAYKHWYYKDNLYKIDAIQKERHALGIPMVKLEAGYTNADIKAAWEMVTNLRTNERAGAVLPPGITLEFANPAHHVIDVMPSIEHHEGMILLNVLAQFLVMGIQSGGGGRATAGSHLDMFQKSLRYVANFICDVFNFYLIPRIVGYNFPVVEFPRMQVRNIGETKELQMFASAMANLASQNLITLDLETEQWVREVVDAPRKLGDVQTPEANSAGFSAAEKLAGATGNGGGGKGNVQTGKPNNGTGSKNAPTGFEQTGGPGGG